jgi:murein L,D-transpeptidase YcbB/YkuD
MRAGRTLVICLCLALMVTPAWATDNTPSPTPAPSTPTAGPADRELAQELATRLGSATASAQSAADREDRAALVKFYAVRQHAPVWVAASGLTPGGEAVMRELRRADEWGLEASAFKLPALAGPAPSRAQLADAEIALSLAILKYARHARGSRADPVTLSRYLDRRPPLLEPGEVIATAAKTDEPDAFLRFLHPKHAQFEALRQVYLTLKGGQKGSSEAGSTSGDDRRAGTGKAAASSGQSSVRRVLVNLEQWRWMPEELGDFYVWVNVPEFTLRVVKNGEVIHTERVVVGKPDTPTPIFSQDMEQVIFHPFWGVPDSIKKADILPSLARGSTRLLTRYNLRIQRGGRDVDPESVDWSSADIRHFHVYQPPGENNLLGTVKFRFPNKHDVYMHDTPTKKLFNAPVRAFSHGCMRVRDPEKLAALLLAEDKGWPAARVAAAMSPAGAHNNQVNLNRKIPVHVTYFTAVAGDDGKLKLHPDIYEHESKIALGIEGKAHLIPRWKEDKAPAQAEVIGSLAESINDIPTKKNWSKRALEPFGNY